MPSQLIAFDDLPRLLLLSAALLFAGISIGILFEKERSARKRDAWRQSRRWRWQRKPPAVNVTAGPWGKTPEPSKLPDAADQLRIVMAAEFSAQALLNRSEVRVFRELDQYVLARNSGWQVMAQVSLGEILASRDGQAYSCINSKRVDLLLVDADCQPRHAIEYQGGGHHQGSAAARDAVKKEALRRAGIGYHEVVAGHTTPSDLKRLVEKLVDTPLTANDPPSATPVL